MLQWGRDRAVPEMSQTVQTPANGCTASMGPGPRGPGNGFQDIGCLRVTRLQWGRDRAVPEIPGLPGITRRSLRLQWGRDRAVPEMLPAVGAVTTIVVLQWGRDRAVPEIACGRG